MNRHRIVALPGLAALLVTALAAAPLGAAAQPVSVVSAPGASVEVVGTASLAAGPSTGFLARGTVRIRYRSHQGRPSRLVVRADDAPRWTARVRALPETLLPDPGSTAPGRALAGREIVRGPVAVVDGIVDGGGEIVVEYSLEPDPLAPPGAQPVVLTYSIESY